ncbi:type II toxin-antitoxin system MqsA family antitoxin [Cognatishimia sp. SS12]|uniref:type II toxin-antitoxin system MqsA family antitoxin n=1 Tax=Cognatishimia sp. SS12 TaxID=2979465 RepID=UPI00232E1B2D|nr:type II toxin-antitoxin system MqsA family antitoxin [Cognatishimia sp. SS12]MDC0738537.1 type II toxin-antitoxin system MqsA family antitoxin [Cognatishimia sp. SS12]
MTNKAEIRRHPETGAELARGVRPVRLAFKSQSMVVDMPGWYSKDDASGESGLFDKKDMLVSDRAINLMKAKELGLLLPEQIKKVRLALGLSQREAGRLIGGGPNAFQKYESGDVLLSKSADTALRLLAVDPRRLQEIRDCDAA